MNIPIKTKRDHKQTTVALTKEQVDFIKSNRINLSALVRSLVDSLMLESLEQNKKD